MADRRRYRAAGAVLLASLAVGAADASAAEAGPRSVGVRAALPLAPEDRLDKLEKRAAKLTKEYRGRVARLEEAKKDAERSAARIEKLQRRLKRVRGDVARLAAMRYMRGGYAPSLLVFTGEGRPERLLADAAAMEHLARNRGARVAELRRVTAKARAARRDVRAKVDRLEATVKRLEKRRGRVRKLLEKFKPQSPLVGDQVTARMRDVRREIDRRFGPFSTIGCYRPNAGEHTEGRACDFMLSAGTMPSAAKQRLGRETADWAKANASRLGIMYIIYRQRIWDIRDPGAGWDPMEDRGGITANHFDHVHISVF